MVIVLGLIVAFILVALFSNRATRGCRWREYPGEDHSVWRCAFCGEQTTGPRGKPPKLCLRPRD
ncbi:hypothetical protein [Primorskyibacter marinus]|uniref:hypothetical protein n=1 Tax=Primorskyibacter marinus TaxID=1977320 RepID=UPI000E2FFD95|nr:hypothetical protein [Primorskyibacter marinus]